ncbi:MAG: ABC transporter permease [Pseudomonadota bacterium]
MAVADATSGKDEQELQLASQWRLMWWAFRRHKLAVVGGTIVLLFYFIALFCEFLSPFDPESTGARDVYHPPQMLRLIYEKEDGGWGFGPHVRAMTQKRDPFTLETTFEPDPGNLIFISFLAKGTPYKLWGIIPLERRLFTASKVGEKFFLLGADRLGRDMLSRILYGARVSMTIGLVGVAISLTLGITLGGVSGYFGGRVDAIIQRLVELILALPTIPIWLGLSASLPQDWSPLTRYFAITAILSLVGWTELARVVRGRFLALRTEDFVVAARLDGASRARVIGRHMAPAMASHIIASVTLAIPLMIIAETSLSFLGLGLQPPLISWGVLLREAQNVQSIAQAPWLFIPGIAVVVAVLSLNFLGDGMRDAADPYAQGQSA